MMLTLQLMAIFSVFVMGASGFVNEEMLAAKDIECDKKRVQDHAWGTDHDKAQETHEQCLKDLASMVDTYVIMQANRAKVSVAQWLSSNADQVPNNFYQLVVRGPHPGYSRRYVRIPNPVTSTFPGISHAVPMKNDEFHDQFMLLKDKISSQHL